MRTAILVIDEDENICREIGRLFRSKKAEVHCSRSIEDGLKHFFTRQYCLVVIDIMLLADCGIPLLGIMRRSKSVPILVLTSEKSDSDKVCALNGGADAFLVKPFSMAECQAVADALIRRYVELEYSNADYPLEYGVMLIIEPKYRLVTVNGNPLNLTRKEYDLLYLLARRPYQVFTRPQIYDYIWGMESYFNIDDAVRFHVRNLRSKLKAALEIDEQCIETVWGVGYRFNPAVLQTE